MNRKASPSTGRSSVSLRELGLSPWFAMVAIALSACADDSRRTAEPASSHRIAHSGSSTCRECHADAYADWASSHHALAERAVDPQLDGESWTAPVVDGGESPSDSSAAGASDLDLRWEGDALQVHALGGMPAGPLEVPRVIGEDPLRQLLVDFGEGRLQSTALAFDPHAREWFDVFGDGREPGEWGAWTGRGMNWNSMCARCHNTALEKRYDRTSDRYATTWAELGVGCEACHGPAADHVAWQRSKAAERDPSLERMRLGNDPERLHGLCGSCHSRRAELHGEHDPHAPFLDLYLPELPSLSEVFYADGQVHDEDYEYAAFSLSRMHHQGVTCTSCHDPHLARPREKGNALCLSCHGQQVTERLGPIDPESHAHHTPGTPGGDCVDCHMPLTTYMQRDPRRDHGFTIPDPRLTIEFGIPNACNRCHTDRGATWAEQHVNAWYGDRMQRRSRERARWVARARSGDPDLGPALAAFFADEPYPAWRAVGTLVLSEYLHDDAVRAALVERLEDPDAIVRVAAAQALDGAAADPRVAAALQERLDDPRRAVRVLTAWALRATVDRGHRAHDELLAYFDHNVDQPSGLAMEASYHFDRGDARKALALLDLAVEWDPGSPELARTRGVVRSTTGDAEGALAELERAVELDPQNAFLHYQHALALSELERLEEAAAALLQAVALQRVFPRAWYNLGLAFHALGRGPEAMDALARACEQAADDAELWFAYASVCRDLGELQRGRFAAERALLADPNHRGARALLDSL